MCPDTRPPPPGSRGFLSCSWTGRCFTITFRVRFALCVYFTARARAHTYTHAHAHRAQICVRSCSQIELVNNIVDTYRDDAMGNIEVHPGHGSVAFTAGKDLSFLAAASHSFSKT